MAIINKLKKKVDLPVWEWLRFAPVGTSATSAMCYGDNLTERYIYYLSGASFYRYDTVTDAWQQLATPNFDATTAVSLRYSSYGGYRGRVISSTANTLTIAGLTGNVLKGYKIRIMYGTGIGQERTIVNTSLPTIQDHGVVTSASANNIADSVKKWDINQWSGYQCRLVYATGQSQVRKILYNDTNTLYFYDGNYQAIDHWSNTGFSARSPFAVPITTAGSQTHYVIESSVITVDSDWDIQPDYTSKFCVLSGVIWMITSQSGNPFYNYQCYDVVSDVWLNKTSIAGLIGGALSTDFTIERTGEVGGIFDNGTVTSATNQSLTDSSKNWIIDNYSNHQIRIISGAGIGQRRRILGNTSNTLLLDSKFDVTPDGTSKYNILANTDAIYLAGNASSVVYQYVVDADMWSQGNVVTHGITSQLTAKMNGWLGIALSSITRNTGGITSLASVPTTGGTNYVIGDILTISGGSNGKARVTGIGAGGVVTSVCIYGAGSGYTVGTGKAVTGGTGSGCTLNIVTIGNVGRVISAINHYFKDGDTITISGATESAWNTTYTILATDGLTTFDIANATATTSVTPANSLSTTVIVDTTQNWITNEHVGRLVQVSGAGYASTTGQVRRITANTATTLTLQSAITAPSNGQSRYVIHEIASFGRDEQFKNPTQLNRGYATGGSTTTLVDNTKNWIPDQWKNYKFRVMCGTGIGNEITITTNSTNTLTFTTQTFTPDATTKYLIMDTFGLVTAGTTTTIQDTTKNWIINQWAGKRVKINSGTGQNQEVSILSNTANTLTFNAITTAPSTDSTYTILSCQPRSVGIELNWIFGNTNPVTRGKYLIVPQGGGATRFDRFDVTTETWEIGLMFSPQTESLSTGSMYCYDGVDRIYFTVNTTGRVFILDVNTLKVEPCGITPYAHSTAIIGNRMEIVETEDGLDYIYIMRHNGQEMWRTLIYW